MDTSPLLCDKQTNDSGATLVESLSPALLFQGVARIVHQRVWEDASVRGLQGRDEELKKAEEKAA